VKKAISIFIILFYLLTNSFPAHADEKMDRQWQDETIYSIMIDRFHNADGSNDQDVNMEDPTTYHGGDFLGIIDKLDYIRDMGFTTISLSPIFDHGDGDYQGYGVNDFYQTDEHFGTIEEFQRLVVEAHNRDMKVMIDFGVKYVSLGSSWLTDPTKEGWLKPQREKEAQPNLLEINLDNREVNQYMVDAAKWWIAETDLDGYRLLFLDEVPESFLKNFSQEVKALKESFYLLGEVKDTDPEKKASYLQAGIDGITDYALSNELRNVFQQPDQSISSLFALIESDSQVYTNPNGIGTFMDNEQMSRFTRETIENNGFALGVFNEKDKMLGFVSLNREVFGERFKYVLLDQMFISKEERHKGIGRKLMTYCIDVAKSWKVDKIYICAGSAEDTIAFYFSIGCQEAEEVNTELYESDPRDYQLEYVL